MGLIERITLAAAFVCVVAGVAFIYWPVAAIVAGVLLAVAALPVPTLPTRGGDAE